jgi:SAM-dependent methyltransferase
MAQFISQKAMCAPHIEDAATLEELLSICNAYYGTNGLDTLGSLADKSVDFVFSQAVLEHIRKHDFLEHLKQMRRIIKDDGICSHSIDLKDHLGGNLNNLRFSEQLWESDLFARSGFYTNRIRYSRMLELFEQARFCPQVVEAKYWSRLPTSREKLSGEFKNLPDKELLISEFDVTLRPV